MVEDNEVFIDNEQYLLYITRLTAQQAIIQDKELFDETSDEEDSEWEMRNKTRITLGILLVPGYG